jgi:uncharacterized RDD family membrane protein YckC
MTLTCPHCDFAREVPAERLPDRPARVTCPRCGKSFSFTPQGEQAPQPREAEISATAAPSPVICPACGFEQPQSDRCAECGLVFAEWEKLRQETFVAPAAAAAADAEALPKAGFWVRAVAALVDGVLVAVIQFLLTFMLTIFAARVGVLHGQEARIAMAGITWLFGMVVSYAYYVFFTGYCGQTPGKMAIRVKVIRTSGAEIGYGRAALREIVGKSLSALILGIGYLMVAFDSQKQGLHDKIADTYVIKL